MSVRGASTIRSMAAGGRTYDSVFRIACGSQAAGAGAAACWAREAMGNAAQASVASVRRNDGFMEDPVEVTATRCTG
jgi:hypothetical protein